MLVPLRKDYLKQYFRAIAMVIMPVCGIYLQYIDCFYAFNILMNLIDMKMDGIVYDLDIMTHSKKLIPEEEWMREYTHTKMLA